MECTGNEFAPENSHCRSCEYGPSTFNLPHRFVFFSDLRASSLGKGQQFLNNGGIGRTSWIGVMAG